MKEIPWFEWYFATTCWKIFKWEKILQWCKSNWKKKLLNKYSKVFINWKNIPVHRLIMLTFVWSSELQVDHINWIKCDNRLENLEYVTSAENTLRVRQNKNKFIKEQKEKWLLNFITF